MSASFEPPTPTSATPSVASSPWQGATPQGRSRSRQLRQATSRAIGVVLFATAVTVAIGAWPLVQGAIDGDRPETARRGLARVLRERGWAVGPPVVHDHRVFEGSPATRRRADRLPPEILEGFPEAPEERLEGRTAMARRPLPLLERAEIGAETAVTVDPATPLMVVKDTGDWLLVALQMQGHMKLGWTPRNSVVILP